MANNTQAPARKKKSAGSVITSIITLAIIVFAGYYVLTNYFIGAKTHKIVINDKTIDLRSSIEDIEKQGFCISKGYSPVKNLDESVRQKQIHNTIYYIGIPDGANKGINTGVYIKVANFLSKNQPLRKCTIYELSYYPEDQDDSVTVLVDGKDMRKASLDDWTASLKEKGFPFSDSELEDFKTGKSKYIANTQGNYKYSASLNYDSKADAETNELRYEYSFKCLQVTRDVKVKTYFTK